MVQTAVSAQSAQWYEGQITRPQDLDDHSARNEDAAVMKVGQTVIKGSTDGEVKSPIASFTFDQFEGVIYDAIGISEKALSTGAIDIVKEQGLTYLRKGYVAVRVTSIGGLTITRGDDVHFAYDAYGDTTLRTYRNSDDLKTATTASFATVSNVVTVTKTAHGLVVGQTIVVSNSTVAAEDGLHVVTGVPTANTFTFDTEEGDSAGKTLDYTTGGASKIPAVFMQSGSVSAGGEGLFEIKVNADMQIGVS